jgi:hypothetical protein
MQFVDIMGLQLLPSKCFPWKSQMCNSFYKYRSVLEEIQLQLEQMSDWRLKNLEDYYQSRQKRKQCSVEKSSEDRNSTLEACL